MTEIFTYPSSWELIEIQRRLMPRLAKDRLGFKLCRMREVPANSLRWEQKDDYLGLQAARGINGAPTAVVPRVGTNIFDLPPGIYGEYKTLDEMELTQRAAHGAACGQPVKIDDLVMEAMRYLVTRELDRIEFNIWTLLCTGALSVPGSSGAFYYEQTVDIPALAGSDWSDFAVANPLADLRAVQLQGRGTSANFGSPAVAYMNRTTWNHLISNTNPNDIGGKRAYFGSTIHSAEEVNTILSREDLPQIVIYDATFRDEAGDVQLFIPDDLVLIAGQRPGNVPLAEYHLTRNSNNPNMGPGPYSRVIDNWSYEIPREIKVHKGHNGGPAVYYPSSLAILNV